MSEPFAPFQPSVGLKSKAMESPVKAPEGRSVRPVLQPGGTRRHQHEVVVGREGQDAAVKHYWCACRQQLQEQSHWKCTFGFGEPQGLCEPHGGCTVLFACKANDEKWFIIDNRDRP